MANKLGVITTSNLAGIPAVTLQRNSLTLEGYFETREELLQLQEMFRKAEGGTTIHTLIGGIQVGYDCTEDSVLTQYCEFDADKLQDGYYLLRSLDINFEQYANYYPFKIVLFFLGTKAFWQDGYSIYGLEELTNDWGI